MECGQQLSPARNGPNLFYEAAWIHTVYHRAGKFKHTLLAVLNWFCENKACTLEGVFWFGFCVFRFLFLKMLKDGLI